tara:strand:- start:1717 stop:2058 length:342 start_codon:yes stop_codon:yes gene_type:complete
MENTYTWSILSLDVIPNIGEMTDYVVESSWTCTGNDGEDHIGQCNGSAKFEVNIDKPNYISFADLTEAEVISWTQASLGSDQLAEIYNRIDDQIKNEINPLIVNQKLPWNISV